MNLVSSFMLFISGGLTVASIMIPEIGLDRSVFSRKAGAIFSGIGVGIGSGIFIYYGLSDGDLVGSILTGGIATTTACLVIYFFRKRN